MGDMQAQFGAAYIALDRKERVINSFLVVRLNANTVILDVQLYPAGGAFLR